MSWQEVFDESSGRSYYYNTATGDTSWEAPPGFVSATAAAAAVAPSTSASTWTQVYDEGSGQYYYYNTVNGDVSWEQPEGYVDPAAASSATDTAPATSTESTGATTPATGGLPEGWIEVSDPSTNSVYYYNQVTGETSWDPPAPVSPPPSSGTGTESTASNTTTAASQVKWIEHYDAGSGLTYYEHPETHETQWNSPYGDAGPPVETAAEDTNNSAATHAESTDAATTATTAGGNASTTGNKVTDGMSLFGSSNLTLPSYSMNDSSASGNTGADAMSGSGSAKSSKRSAYVFAPDEFAAEFISLGNKANNTAQNHRSKMGGYDDDDDDVEEEEDETGHGGSGGMGGGHGNNKRHGSTMTVSETMSMLNDFVEWSDINQSTQLSDQLLQTIPYALLSSPKMLSALTRKLTAFTMLKYAETYFQFDRRGNQMLTTTLEKLISYQSEPLKTSLTSLPSTLAMEAITCFKEIQYFMESSNGMTTGGGMGKSPGSGIMGGGSVGLTSSGGGGSTSTISHQHHQNSHLLDIALNLIQKLILAPIEFHDEIYLQIMKQVKRNPSIESTELGWQLMLMLLSSIPPSKKLLPFLLTFCSQNVESLQDEAKKFAAFSLKICCKSALTEIRKELPTRKEIQAILLGEQIEVKVQVIDGQVLVLFVDSFTTIKTFESTIAETLAIAAENYPIFALFEYREGKTKLLSTSDRVLDIVSTWEKGGGGSNSTGGQDGQSNGLNPGQGRGGSGGGGDSCNMRDTSISQIYHDFESSLHSRDFFFYQVHIYYFPSNLEGDLVTKRLLYYQAVQDIVSAYYPHTLQDGLMLAALQLHISYGDYVVGKEIKEFRSSSSSSSTAAASSSSSSSSAAQSLLQSQLQANQSLMMLKRILSAMWLELRDDNDDLHSHSHSISRAEIESRILSLYKKLVGIPKEMAMTMFLSYASTWKLYGAKYYIVKGQLDNTGHFTHDLVIALTPRSVIIIDVSTNSFLADYNYDQIYSWGHSFDSFVLVIGSKSTQVKSYFRTSQGKEIEEMLKIYANQNNPNGDGKDPLNSSIVSFH